MEEESGEEDGEGEGGGEECYPFRWGKGIRHLPPTLALASPPAPTPGSKTLVQPQMSTLELHGANDTWWLGRLCPASSESFTNAILAMRGWRGSKT